MGVNIMKVMKYCFLSFLIMFLLCACERQNEETQEIADEVIQTGSITETESQEQPDLPEVDYQGQDVLIYTDGFITEAHANLYAVFEETGTPLSAAGYVRYLAVEDRLGIEICMTLDNPRYEWNILQNSVQAGDQAYDMATGIGSTLSGCITGGFFADLNALQYLDTDRSWYLPYVNEEAMLLDKMYSVTGYYDMATFERTYVTYFSTKLANDYNMEDLYGLVNDGRWTYDKMISLAEVAANDLDGDNVMTESDQYGICLPQNIGGQLICATGYRYTTKNEDGTRRLTGTTDLLLNFNEMLVNMYKADWQYSSYYYNADLSAVNNNKDALAWFPENRYLFFIYSVSAAKGFGESMDDYGILPIPKYTEEQQTYYSVSSPALSAVPKDAPDMDLSGMLIEALNYESKMSLMPAYYDVSLSKRYVSSQDASDMLDIIFANVAFDFLDFFGNHLGQNPYLHCSVGLYEDYVSYFKSNYNRMQTGLDNIFDTALKNAGK